MRTKIYIISIIAIISCVISSCKTSERVVTKQKKKVVVQKIFVRPPKGQTWAAEIADSTSMGRCLDSLCHFTGLVANSTVGIEVVDLTDGHVVYAHNRNQRMRPASCMKLLTSITALDTLGADYTYCPEVPQAGWGWCWDDDETKEMPYVSEKHMTVQDVLQPMMKKSNNLMAESMFCQLATVKGAAIENRDSSAAVVLQLMRRIGIDERKYCVADGSGLSLYNYVTPDVLVRFMKYAYNKESIYKYLYKSLPIAGVDGTLKNRMKNSSAHHNVHAKTGSVTGVSSLSGYCTAKNGHTLCFSIINQGVEMLKYGRDFQDEACEIMCR